MTIHSVVIQKLLSTNAHLGRRIANHHFKIYTYGSRNGLTIIDSDKTLICLRNATAFISQLVRHNARFLFVNTNPLCDQIVSQMTHTIGLRNDSSYRLGGFLTNSSSPKKFRSRNKKFVIAPVHPPDCVVILDSQGKTSVIAEAAKKEIPIVALVDSDTPLDVFNKITYPVPANDSVQFVYLFCNLITKTFLSEQKKMGVDSNNPKDEIREVMESLEASKTSLDEILVMPYESLEPFTDDPIEIREVLDKLVVVVKNNRYLDRRMSFGGETSAIEARNELTCLAVIVNRIESINSKYGCNIPLVLINSESTHDATLKVLENHANKNVHTLVQSPHNKNGDQIRQRHEYEDYFMASFSDDEDEEKELLPVYQHEVLVFLQSKGNLDAFLSQGKEYILVINSDNLADVVDPKILNHLIQKNIEYCMEVIPTESSGTNEKPPNSHKNKYKLKDISRMQVKKTGERAKLTDTTNLWLDMKAISRVVERGALDKWKYPTLKYFTGSIGLKVPETRYLPLESTSNLLLLQSNLFTCSEGVLIRDESRERSFLPSIKLGPEFDKVSDFRRRFKSIPSIIDLDSLKVSGDVSFGTGVTLKGNVEIRASRGTKLVIPDGAVLEDKVITSKGDI